MIPGKVILQLCQLGYIWARLTKTVQFKFEIVKKMTFIVGDCTIRFFLLRHII